MPFIVRMSRQKISWHGGGTFHDAYRGQHASHWVQSWTNFVCSCSWTGATLIWCDWPGTDEYWMCGLFFSRWYFSILSHSKRIHSLWMNACIQTTSPYDVVKFFFNLFSESEAFEAFCPARLDELLKEALRLEQHLKNQKERLRERLMLITRTLQSSLS